MTDSHYEALSYMDASFLALEPRSSHRHVVGVPLFAAAPLKAIHASLKLLMESKL